MQQVTQVMGYIAGVTVALLSLLITVTVVLRYFFGVGTGWSTEVSTYMLFVIALCAAPRVQLLHKHIRVDLLVPRLSRAVRSPLRRVTDVIGLLLCVAIAGYGGSYTLTLYERGDAVARVLSVPKWPFMALITFSFGLLAVVFLAQLRSRGEGEEPADE